MKKRITERLVAIVLSLVMVAGTLTVLAADSDFTVGQNTAMDYGYDYFNEWPYMYLGELPYEYFG